MDPDLRLHDFSTLAREADGPPGGCPWLRCADPCPRTRGASECGTASAAAVLTAALAAGLLPPGAAPGASASPARSPCSPPASGAKEVPGPGDPDGRGRAFVRLAGGKACFVLEWSKINAPIAAHIHEGRAGVAGPVVVLFFQPGTNAASLPDTLSSVAGCVDVDRGLARKIAANPSDYYVNIHTADFPDGAIRGQLHRCAPPRPRPAAPAHGQAPGPTRSRPADPDGRGLAFVRTGRQRVCFAVGWSGSPRPSSPTSTTAWPGSTARWWCCSSTCPSSRRRADGHPPRHRQRRRRLRRRPGPGPAARHPPASDRLLREHPHPRVPARGHPRPAPPRRLTDPGGRTGPRWDGPQRGPSVVGARAARVAPVLRPSASRRPLPAPARPRTSRAS